MTTRSEPRRYRVLVVEDHPLIRLGLSHALADDPELELCGEAETESDALRLVESVRPDAAIVDLNLRSGSGLDVVKRIAQHHGEVRTVVSSMCEAEVYQARVLRAGADAYVCKDRAIAELLATVKEAAARGPLAAPMASDTSVSETPTEPTERLTDRELEVFRLVGEGQTTREIAAAISRSVKTVETHKSRIKQKLGLASAAELAREAIRWMCEHQRPAA